MNWTWADLAPFLTFAGGIIVTVITTLAIWPKNKSEVRKNDAEGDATLAKVTMDFTNQVKATLEKQIEDLREDSEKKLDGLKERIISLETENRIYRKHNAMLIEQLVGAGIRPVEAPLFGFPPHHDD